MWYATVKFEREMFCGKCEARLARRASERTIVDSEGNFVGGDYDGSDYLMACDECDHVLEISSPEDVQRWKYPEHVEPPAKIVMRLE